MSQEHLCQFGDLLGLMVVSKLEGAGLRLNQLAQNSLGGSAQENLRDVVAQLLDHATESDLAAIDAVLNEAPHAGKAIRELSDRTLLIATHGFDHALTVLIDRRATELAHSLRERVAAADLAAGVSHEVSNALSAIIGWSRIASERPDKAPPEEALAMIEQSAQAARAAAQDLLRAVRSSVEEEARSSVGALVVDVVRLLRPEALRRRVQITHNVEEGCWIAAKRSQLFSIVWNLAHNAVQMVPPGGFVYVSVTSETGRVRLEIRDNGPGMTEDQKRKAFEPYFTTRKDGTGLGLSIVRKNVEAIGGTILLETSPGDGASFRIELPRVAYTVDSTKVRKASRISRVMEDIDVSNMRVLVVEDDQGVRELIATTLELAGIQVATATNAKEATRLAGEFTLAVIDLNLPDNRGDILLATLREQGSVNRAILMTGGAPPDDADSRGVPDRWLRKPFEPTEMLSAMRDVFDDMAQRENRRSSA